MFNLFDDPNFCSEYERWVEEQVEQQDLAYEEHLEQEAERYAREKNI